MSEATIRLHVEQLEEGGYLATSPDVPGLVAQGRGLTETAKKARNMARKIAVSCPEHGYQPPKGIDQSTMQVGFSLGFTMACKYSHY